MVAALAASFACGPQLASFPTDPDDTGGGGPSLPISVVIEGDSIFGGTLRPSGIYVCRIRLNARLLGGGGGATVAWTSGEVTFKDPGTGAIRSSSGWSQDMLIRFLGMDTPRAPVPGVLEGGPTEFGDSEGQPYLLELRLGFVPSDSNQLTHRTWRVRCT